MRDSSQRPGEEDSFKGLAREAQRLSVADLKADLPPQPRREQALRTLDLPGVWVDADSAVDDTGDPPGEPAVTAPDLQDTGPTQGCMPHEHSHFRPLGIPSQALHRSHLSSWTFHLWAPEHLPLGDASDGLQL